MFIAFQNRKSQSRQSQNASLARKGPFNLQDADGDATEDGCVCVFLFGHMKPKKRRRDTKMENTLKLVAHAPFKRVIELMKKCL